MKRGTPEHPKTKRFARELAIELYAAAGLLEMLFHFTSKYSPQGDIGKFSDADIAEALRWERDPSELVTAFLTAGFLEPHPTHRLIVHDFHEHADDSTKKTLKNRSLDFVTRTENSPIDPEDSRTTPGKTLQIQNHSGKVPNDSLTERKPSAQPFVSFPLPGPFPSREKTESATADPDARPPLPSSDGKSEPPPTEDALELSDLMLEYLKTQPSQLLRHLKGKTNAEIRSDFAKAWDFGLRNDLCSLEEARELIAWLSADETKNAHFWRLQILAVKPLFESEGEGKERKFQKAFKAMYMDQTGATVPRNGHLNGNGRIHGQSSRDVGTVPIGATEEDIQRSIDAAYAEAGRLPGS